MKNSGVIIIVAAVAVVGGIWFYTRSKVPVVVGASGGSGSGSFLSGLENLGVSTGTNLAGQGINAGLGALTGSGTDGTDDSGDSSDDSDDDSG
jgi:hypothetical protein